MSRLPGLRRTSLLLRFSLLSAACVILLGLGVGSYLDGQIRERAMADARARAELLADEAVRPLLARRDLATGVRGATRARLDAVVRSARGDGRLARVKIWNREGRIVYSDEHSAIGRRFAIEDDLEAAFSGEVHAGVTSGAEAEQRGERGFGRLLEVYVPLSFTAGGRPAGAFELYTPYTPVAAAVREDVRTVYGLLAGGLLLLWLVLFRIVARASRTLHAQAERHEHAANHDELTGLPNRRALLAVLRRTIEAAGRDRTSCALLLLDLDGFKDLNDTLGHGAGDALLREIGPRLERALAGRASVARVGGDEFAVVLPAGSDEATARRAAADVRAALAPAFGLDGLEVVVEASVGVALFPGHADDSAGLLQRADVAMYQAKRDRTGVEVYDSARDCSSRERLALAADLRAGLGRGELEVHFQPQAGLRDGAIVGVEALVRWRHPERGLLGPAAFVDLAETSGLARPLALEVLDRSLAQVAAWAEEGLSVTVAVNLSVANLLDTRLPDDVAALLEGAGVEAERLVLEITESAVMADPARCSSVLQPLRELGVGLALDDFGTGYSSLAHLRDLPVDELKVDRSFVARMAEQDEDAAIVRSTIELGHALGLRVVAEGVEDVAAWRCLRDLRCDVAQGYFLSRPAPAAELTPWLLAAARRGEGIPA